MGGLYQAWDPFAITRGAHGVAQTIQGSRRLGLAQQGQDRLDRSESRSLEEERAMQEANDLMLRQDQSPRAPMGAGATGALAAEPPYPGMQPEVYGSPEPPVYGPQDSPVAQRAAEAVRTHPFTQRQPVFTPQEDAEFDDLFHRVPSAVQDRMYQLREEQRDQRINKQTSAQFQASFSRGLEMGWLDENVAQAISQDIEDGKTTAMDAIGVLRQEQQNYAARKGMDAAIAHMETWLKGEVGIEKKPEGMGLIEWGDRVHRAYVALNDFAADPSVGEVGSHMDSTAKMLEGDDGPSPEEQQKDRDAAMGRMVNEALTLMRTPAAQAGFNKETDQVIPAMTFEEAMAQIERKHNRGAGGEYGMQGPPLLIPGQADTLNRQEAPTQAAMPSDVGMSVTGLPGLSQGKKRSIDVAVEALPEKVTAESIREAMETAHIPYTKENIRAFKKAVEEARQGPASRVKRDPGPQRRRPRRLQSSGESQ